MSNIVKKNIFSFILTIGLLIVIYHLVDKDHWQVLKNVSIIQIFYSIIFALVIQAFSGFQYYLVRKEFGVKLEVKDIFLLPSMMGLWSFILPFQGSLIFSTLFFKHKYKMKIQDSFSINIYFYMVTLSFTGLIGLLFSFKENMYLCWFRILSIIFLLNPLLIILLRITLENIKFPLNKMVKISLLFLNNLSNNINRLWGNYFFTVKIIMINIIKIVISIAWFYYIAKILGYNLSIFEIALISLIMNVTYIIKITPGNLGTSQLITGGFMGLIGSSSDEAILISLIATTTLIIINITLGLLGNYLLFNTDY